MRLHLNLFKLCLNYRREQDVRIAAQLRLLMESRASSTSVPQVVVVASTNRCFFFHFFSEYDVFNCLILHLCQFLGILFI